AEKPGVLTRLLGETPLERFISWLNTRKPDAQTAEFVGLLARSWVPRSEQPEEPLAVGINLPDLGELEAGDPSRLGYYYVADERDPSRYLLLVRVYHQQDFTSLTAISETVEAIRAAAKSPGKDFPEFTIGVTRRPALEADEMRTTDRDSHKAEVVALIAVFVGLALFLRSIWLAL